MPLMRITIPGLISIACAVVLLWACILGQGVLMRRAQAERDAVMRSIRLQQRGRQPQPVAAPPLRIARPRRPVAG